MNFVKMQGIGNDYVYVDCFKENVKIQVQQPDLSATGGLASVQTADPDLPSDVADCRMEMYNTDGSQGKMCGNGIRCVGSMPMTMGLFPRIGEA